MNNPYMNTTYMMEREMNERPERARRLADADNLPDPLLQAVGAVLISIWRQFRFRRALSSQAHEIES